MRRSQRESIALFTTPPRVSTRTNPLVMLPRPYRTTIGISPEGTRAVRVCGVAPEEMPCSVIVRVLPFSVSFDRASNSTGTLTKAFSSDAYHRLIEPSLVDKYRIPSGGVRRFASLDVIVMRGLLSIMLHCWTIRTGESSCQHRGIAPLSI